MIQLVKGFRDILPGTVELWQKIEQCAADLFEDFGFREIRVPIMESTELFARSIGEQTDIVEKEMYTFADRGGQMLTLRPEATASVVRSYIQHKMYAQDPIRKFYTIGPMFRRERPQKGRYRQFYQINAEVFGIDAPYIDAQLIDLLVRLFQRLQVGDSQAHINSLGCPDCRPQYKDALQAFLDQKQSILCADCQRRKDRNPLRVLDCKVEKCRQAMVGAPVLSDFLCSACRHHFDTVQRMLGDLDVDFALNPNLVRGLDYYTRTAFEIQTGALGAQSAVAGGGRYDGLVRALGGPDVPAIGFAIGFDRLAELVGLSTDALMRKPDVFIAALGQRAMETAFSWRMQLGHQGVGVSMDYGGKSLKSQMKRAGRLGAAHVLIVGDAEINGGAAILRDMQTRQQHNVPLDQVIETLGKLKR